MRGGGGPGAGAVDELFCAEEGGGSLDFDVVAGRASGEDGGAGAEVDGGGVNCGEKCGGELAGIEAVFVEEDEAVVAGCENWEEVGEVFASEFAGLVWRVGWKSLQGSVGLEGGADAGERVEAVEEGGIE